ncbi:MAG TPA: CorA family divalent cation transporter [Candidatus Paceibacterota bacterium]|nr:CorA family divalent cation transporter [Candidatus Paceibacterota bacterium]
MIFRYEYRGGVWIDLEQPSEDEIRQIAKEFSISGRLERELLSPTPTPLVAGEEDMALLVLHFPAHGAEDGITENQEVDFIVSRNFILTVRYEVIAPLHHLQKLLETQKMVSGHPVLTTDVLLEVLFAHLYTSVHDHTSHIVSHLARIERDMFDGFERKTILSILQVSREFLHMETALADQEEPLGRFLTVLAERTFFGTPFLDSRERILTQRMQIERLVETHRAVVTELRETNMALVEARQNEIMKTLTVITFSMLPLELIALVFGMHMLGTPLEQNPNAFWIIVTSMIGIVGVMTLFFARKRWIF